MAEQEDSQPYYSALLAHCAAQPGATEKQRWGETLFKVRGRVFAFMNSPSRPAVTVKVRRDQVRALLASAPEVSRSRYVGRFGWLTVAVHDELTLRLAYTLIDRSYREVVSGR